MSCKNFIVSVKKLARSLLSCREQLAAMIIKPAKLVVVPQINAKQLMQRLRHLDIDEVNQPAIVVQTTIRAASQARALTEVSRAGARYRTIGARVQPRTGKFCYGFCRFTRRACRASACSKHLIFMPLNAVIQF